MLGKRIKFYLTIGLALIVNLYLCSALYSDSRQGHGGGQGQGRSAQGSVSTASRASSMPRSAPVSGSRGGGIQQSQPSRPAVSARIDTPASVSRPSAVQSRTPAVRSAEPSRPNTSANTHNVSGNPSITVRSPQNAPTVSVAPTVSQNRNTEATTRVITDKGGANRSANQPQRTVERRDSQQSAKSPTVSADSGNAVVAREQPSVKISTERTSRVGKTIGEGRTADAGAGKTNQPAGSVARDRTGSGNGRVERDAKITIPQSKTEKIGSVIGKDNSDKGIADNRGGRRAERQVAKATDNRSVNTEKITPTVGNARERLTNRENNRRQTPESALQTRPGDSARKERTIEQKGPGYREEKVLGNNVRETTTIRDRNIVEKRVEYRQGQHSRTIVFHDRPREVRHVDHFRHTYWDYHHNFRSIVVWPGSYFYVGYGCGPYWSFNYVHPFYHRKYIFVSLGGWWPEYNCIRYYWYPYHYYDWYGYYPVPQEFYSGSTYNYYTYNYYNTGADNSSASTTDYPAEIPPVDQSTFADVRAKMQQEAERNPDAATQADAYFEEAVKAFEINCFNLAADKFAEAMKLAPDDVILPFAYAQALLALERYNEAADVLRAALVKVTPDKEGVFYPRGLYADEDVLTKQIELLDEKTKLYPYDADLQLLLGYQMLGLDELDEAETHLTPASQDIKNAPAANVLLDLLAKMRARIQDSNEVQSNPQ